MNNDFDLILGENINKKSVNSDYYGNVKFEETSGVLPTSNISKIVNSYQVFDDERNSSTKYSLTTSINLLSTNVLVNPITIIYDSDGNQVNENQRLALIQTIDSENYTYLPGYDIFDNNFYRLDTFKTGNTIDDFTGTTLKDLNSIYVSIDKNLFEENGWVYIFNKTKINGIRPFKDKMPCEKIDLFPTRDYFSLKPMLYGGTLYPNWGYFLTFPYRNETNHRLVSDSNNVNGLPIIGGYINYSESIGNYLCVYTPYKHGLVQGDVIRFKTSTAPYGNTYLIYDIGDADKNNKEYMFLIDVDKYSDLTENSFINSIKNKRIVKIENGFESKYYIRVFRKIPNFKNDDEPITDENISQKILTGSTNFLSESYQLGFSKNIYGDSIQQIQFLDDINIEKLTDNLQRPLTEIYLTVIKNTSVINLNGLGSNPSQNYEFGVLTSGIDEPSFSTGYTNIRYVNGNNNNELPLEKNICDGGSVDVDDNTQKPNEYYGDIVEYNPTTVKENILDVVNYRFNTTLREANDNYVKYHDLNDDYTFELVNTTTPITPRNEGYYYKPHQRIIIKNYSDNIQEGELTELNVCSACISGVTTGNTIVHLSGATNSEIMYLAVKIDDTSTFLDFDRIRVGRYDFMGNLFLSKNYNIRLRGDYPNVIFVLYDYSLYGNANNIPNENLKFKRYFSDSIPSYCEDLGDGRVFWRDILAEGVFDENSTLKTEIPFTNGRFYVNKNINLYLRRQDPFGQYGLMATTFPVDLYGDNNQDFINDNTYNNIEPTC